MKLEEITAEIRPRTQWEAVDLGVTMTRRHFAKLAQIWILTAFPIWAILFALLHNHPVWFLLSVWFLLPMCERPVIYYLSRALFNAPPRVRDVLKNYPGIIMPGLIRSLTIARFSPVRSLLLPLHVLEGAKGQQYGQRRLAILRSGGGTAGWLTCVCVFIELILMIGFVFLTVAFIPQHIAPDWGEMFIRFFTSISGFWEGLPPYLAWFATAILLTSVSFVEIFYVGCGFALYLNSRSMVEGWDIEITFRRLSSKLTKLTAPLIALLGAALFLTVGASNATAQDEEPKSYDHVKAEIREVMEHDDFIVHTKKVKVPEFSGEFGEPSNLDLGFIAQLGEVLFWLVIAAAVGALGWIIYLNRHLFMGDHRVKTDPVVERTRTVMGMDIASDTLPDDIPAAALAAWRNGDPQLATSLLYRGSICWLVEAAHLPLIDSDTEGDCINHSNTLGDAGRHSYFSGLTSKWISTAYNDAPPTEPEMQELCSTWPFSMKGASV